jgi:hypothetical protein
MTKTKKMGTTTFLRVIIPTIADQRFLSIEIAGTLYNLMEWDLTDFEMSTEMENLVFSGCNRRLTLPR